MSQQEITKAGNLLPALAQFEVLHRARLDGDQIIARFPNGYGVSVIRGAHTYGGGEGWWELAVLRYTGPGMTDFDLCYDTPVTDDVIGWLDETKVAEIAQQIVALPPVGPAS